MEKKDKQTKNEKRTTTAKFVAFQGNFGDVYRGLYKPQKLEVAVKTCRETLSEDAKKKFLQEGRILKQYDHPNIVKFIGIAAQRQPVMIVMEYVPGGFFCEFRLGAMYSQPGGGLNHCKQWIPQYATCNHRPVCNICFEDLSSLRLQVGNLCSLLYNLKQTFVWLHTTGGALLNFLKKRGQDQTTRQLVKMCLDASAGMEYLEGKSCIHR